MIDQNTVSTSGQAGTVLVVDDTPVNLDLVTDLLEKHGYTLLVATDGKRALSICQRATPDLVLLDVMMPGLNGFEVCKRLKAHVATQDIPVIFMTALNNTEDKLRGFEVGGADYITKPVQREDLLARVRAHIQLFQSQRALIQRSDALAALNAELDAFAHTVAHDLKDPLNSVLGFSQLLEDMLREQDSDAQMVEIAHRLGSSASKMFQIIEALLLLAGVNRQQQVTVERLAMDALLDQLLNERLAGPLASYEATIERTSPLLPAMGYEPWVEEIWSNYLSNALKYGGRPPHVQVGSEQRGTRIHYWVQDNGAGLSEESRSKLFTPFTRLHQVPDQEGHGLGLSIVQRIVTRLDGECGVESQPGQGSRFYFELPAAD